MPPGRPLSRANVTPLPPSRYITGARWLTGRYDPPSNQWGDILPTVWSDDGSTYVLMDDGGTDVPVAGGLWRQSFAKITGSPPNLRFKHVGDPTSPPPQTWAQIGNQIDNDDGPLGPYYSIGFAEAGGVFYATQQRDWNWSANGPFTGLVGIAYSTNHGKTWRFPKNSFPAPLGNLTFVDGGGPGGAYPDGYMYAVGTEREFNASRLLLGRVPAGVANVTDPAKWQWYTGSSAGVPQWSSSVAAAVPVLNWSSHITYPEMAYDAGLHRYLLTFTYSYKSAPPGVWKGGAELVIAESPTPWGPFSFVAGSRDIRPVQRLRRRLPVAVDQRERPPAVAQMGRELRRMRQGPRLLGQVRLQRGQGAAHGGDSGQEAPREEHHTGAQGPGPRHRRRVGHGAAVAGAGARRIPPAVAALARLRTCGASGVA